MPPIDYTIPGQFKGVQIESPINRMAAIEQLENARNQNALAQFQLGAAQRAETKETNRMRLLGEAGGDETAVANALLKSGDVAGYSAYVKAIEDRKTQKLTQTKTTGDIVTTRLSQFKDLLNTINPDAPDAGAKYLAWHEANHADEYIGPLLARRGVTADQSRASIDAAIKQGPAAVAELINKSRLGIDKFRENQKAEAKELRERAEKLYPAYQLSEYEAGNEPLTLDEFVAQRMQTTAAPTTVAPAAAAPAPEFLGAEGAEGVVTKSPDGSVNLPPVTKSAGKMPSAFGSDVHPLVPSLIAAGNKDMATIVQEGHKASGALRQINDSFKELDRLETEKPKGWEARSKALRDYIKVVSTEGPGTRVQVGVKLPEGVKAVDQKYAQDYLDWSQGGGADAAANLGQIKSVLDRLASGEALTGKSIGLAPDFFNALVNPAALGAKQQVEEVVQRNLRAVLGAQFTQVEGERLIARAFDARLSPQENAKRLRKLFLQMQTAAQQKQAMAEYYEANETLRGYKGKQPKMQDFFDVLSTPDAPPKGSVDVNAPDGKVYRFSSQQAADKFKKDNGIKD
jgi:tetratricopeptide (TPR) repeat protein